MAEGTVFVDGGAQFADDVIVADGHSDIVVDILRRREAGASHVFGERHAGQLNDAKVRMMMLATGGDGPTQNIGSDDPFWSTMKRLHALLADFDETPEVGSLCTSMAEVDRTIGAGRFAGLMMIEGASPLSDSLERLDIFYRLGIRSLQLTWNARNFVGDGCGESQTRSGLTRFGKALVAEMNRKRMLLDLSHASESLFYSAAETTSAPFIVSHANARALCDHPRNLTDHQIRLLAEQGGTLGLCFFPGFVDPERPSIDRLLDHLDHIAGLVGVRHITIGADFIYFAPEIFAQELEATDRSGMYSGGFSVPDDLQDPRGFLLLARGMKERGYSDHEISDVLGRNLLRLYRDVIG